jgi:hypothetical protein
VDTLISGKDCVFESEDGSASTDVAAQEAQNIRFARELATAACGRVARSNGRVDKQLSQLCQREFSAAADSCGLEGASPLIDGKGRFAPAARACYLTLADVLHRITFTAMSSSQCCQCLASSCKAPADKCYRDLARATPDRSALACIQGACAEACANALVSGAEPPPAQGAALPPIPPSSKKAPSRHASHEL